MLSFFKTYFNLSIKLFKRFLWIGITSFMIGISNVVMEEDRSINDTRIRIEEQQQYEEEE